MESQRVWHLSFMWTWIFVFSFLSVCSGMGTPKLYLKSTVFMAISGTNLNIDCEVAMPANASKDVLKCYDPSPHEIYECDVPPKMTGQPQNVTLKLELKNLTISGEYRCDYKLAKVYLFVRVISKHNSKLPMIDITEFIIVGFFTGVLLVFSVVGSVCYFRGHGKDCITGCDDTGRKQKQNQEERRKSKMEEDNVDATTDPSTSFYASLEARPGSIYDVLDRSAANREPYGSKPKPKKREPQETMAQTTQEQPEGIFESVYENC